MNYFENWCLNYLKATDFNVIIANIFMLKKLLLTLWK